MAQHTIRARFKYKMTSARQAALKKAQAASARARSTGNRLLQRVGIKSTGAGQGPSGRSKVYGTAARRTSTGPSSRRRSTGAGAAVAALQRKYMKRGAKRSTAFRTASRFWRMK